MRCPKKKLIKNIKPTIHESGADLLAVPRINIHPGCTQEWLDKHKFRVNEVDWINWPDYQGRIFKNDSSIKIWKMNSMKILWVLRNP
jgi:hypothetical protein